MKIKLVLAIFILSLLPITQTSCGVFKRSNVDNKEKEIQKEKKRRQKEDTVLYQKAVKEHMKRQSKETRKAMKQAMKEAERNREHKPEPWYKRLYQKWFGYKQKQNKG
jgi:ABC-type amino acid transport substrate-binding protein